MKKHWNFALVAAAALLLAGCSSSTTNTSTEAQTESSATAETTQAEAGQEETTDTAGDKRDNVVIALTTDVSSLNPYGQDNNVTNQVMFHICLLYTSRCV